jgi:hypothetical protein
MDADPGIDLQLSANIAFRETMVASKPFVETLREFSRLANSIVNLFK